MAKDAHEADIVEYVKSYSGIDVGSGQLDQATSPMDLSVKSPHDAQPQV